ncbi:hypothetical protein DPQ22_09145 [Candidatus Tokpelaia sp.]|nr:hypothetical protein DPQ22_09145 [Candidatus Tokpelaia sp.]
MPGRSVAFFRFYPALTGSAFAFAMCVAGLPAFPYPLLFCCGLCLNIGKNSDKIVFQPNSAAAACRVNL